MIIITVILSLFIISFWFLGYFYMQADSELKRVQREINSQKRTLNLKIEALKKQQAIVEKDIKNLKDKIKTTQARKQT